MADVILTHIKQNPGVSVSGIHRKLRLNPSPARTCIQKLVERGLIQDKGDEGGHAYFATSRM
jgi:predicted transcriptional regulator